MDKVLHAVDTLFSELLGDDAVIGEWNSSSLSLTMSSLVEKLRDGLSGWETVSDEWFDHLDHVPGSLVKLDEDTVVQLSQSEELQDLLWLWGKLTDTI